MRELIYTLLELERESRKTCDFCSNRYGEDNRSVNQIVSRIKVNNEYVSDDVVCEDCKEKFLNDEIPKCNRCGRLQTELDISILCPCIRRKEDLEEKELPSLPYQRESMITFYERQINTLREEKDQLTEEVDTHLEALESSEVWNKRQKQELLDKIAKLEEENKQLREEKKVELYEKEITGLKEQLEQLNQQITQIETPPKDNKIKNFLKFTKSK